MYLRVRKLDSSSQEQQDDALANQVYVSESTIKGTVAMVGDILYRVESRSYLNQGEIALNLLQRKELCVKPGDIIKFNWVKDSSIITTLTTLQVCLVNSSEPISLSSGEVQRMVRDTLINRPIQSIQYTLVDNSTIIQCRVETSLKRGAYYRITDKTELKITNRHVYIRMLEDQPSAVDLNMDTLADELDVGGLDEQIAILYRRVFASRRMPPKMVKELEIQHVRGILLYGPPGCGKTLLARQLGKLLGCTTTTIVNGPELLNMYVGQSEENAREMFRNAQEDPHPGHLHLIICDEFDALCRKRGSSSHQVSDNLVNTILSMLDGVNQLNNILFIGLTNRKELIDEAILRPGRLEVHLYVGLPDTKGREKILKIHLRPYIKTGRLDDRVSPRWLAQQTVNYTGAELAGLVRNATSHAMVRCTTDDFQLTRDDFIKAMNEQGPALTNDTQHLQLSEPPQFSERVGNWIRSLPAPPAVVVITGGAQQGKTQLALQVSQRYSIAYVRLLTADQFVATTDLNKAERLQECFQAAQTAGSGVIILDDWDLWLGPPPFGGLLESSLIAMVKGVINRRQQLVLVITATDASKIPNIPCATVRIDLHDDCQFNIT